MNEEIKELLYCDMYNDLDDKKYEKLLNYITNLQKENKKLKENNKRKTSRCTERNHKIRARDRIIERRNKKIDKLEDYKQRNKKAVEFIKEWWYEKNTRDINRIVSLGDKRIDLLNILQGGDE